MKNAFTLLFFFMTFCVFAQENKSKEIAKDNKNAPIVETTLTQQGNNSNNPILERTPLPVNQKAGPAVFYVKNDKPISEADYLHDKDRIKTSINK